jgi:hypothetical protein
VTDQDVGAGWGPGSWEGSRREQLRRARELTVRERLEALEDLARLSERLQRVREARREPPLERG